MPRPSPTRDRIIRLLLRADAQRRGARWVSRPSAQVVAVQAASASSPHSLYAVAAATGASYAWVHEAVTDFVAKGWVTVDNGIHVSDPRALLDWWSAHRTPPSVHGYHVADPLPLFRRLYQHHGIPYAMTTYYAENWYQGHLFARRADAYVRAADLPAARRAVIEGGGQIGGSNFRLWTGDDSLVDEALVGGALNERVRFAPLPQVIVDLRREGASAGEAADMLIDRDYPHARPRLS